MTAVRPLDLTDPRTVDDLVALQRAAYAVEAELLGTTVIPALNETAEQLAASGERFLGAHDGDRLVGAVSFRHDGDTLDIHRLVVDPAAFRRGIATALLAALPAAPRTVVSTGMDNAPARALYERHGFRVTAETVVDGGLRLVQLERR